MFESLTSFSIHNPPAHTRLVFLQHASAKGKENCIKGIDLNGNSHNSINDANNYNSGSSTHGFPPLNLLKRCKRTKDMSSHYRSTSPGGRRLGNPARVSEPYYTTTYTSPRSSTERVIPISTTTYMNAPRTRESLDGYTGRPRRSTLTEPGRPSSAHVHTHSHTHARPATAVVHTHTDRPSSPLARTTRPDYYLQPASTSAPRREHSSTHKKVYSIDDGKSHLVADIDINPARTHRRTSLDRNGYRSSSHRTAYHLTGAPVASSDQIDIDSGFSYTDPAGMYKDTEPRRRVRSGSVEGSRPRPNSMIADAYPSRSSARETGPPTSRALDRYNVSLGMNSSSFGPGLGAGLGGGLVGAGLVRGGSLRDTARSSNRHSYHEPPPASPYMPPQESHHNLPSKRHSASLHQERLPERRETYPQRDPYDERRELRESDRSRAPPPRVYEDRSVETRGFGIRPPGRGSDESLDRRETYLERAASPTSAPRDLAPRRDQERRDYEYAREHDRDRSTRDREYRDVDRKERERLRDDQAYMSDRDRERTRPRRESVSYRDHDRHNQQPKTSAESLPGILPAAIGGLGAAAAAGAIGRTRERDKDQGYHSTSDSGRDERSRRHRDREHHRAPEDSSSDRERRGLARDADNDRAAPEQSSQNYVDPEEDFRRRIQQAQRDLGTAAPEDSRRSRGVSDPSPDGDHRRRERSERPSRQNEMAAEDMPPRSARRSPDESSRRDASAAATDREGATKEGGRVRIVDPPKKEDQQPIKGILRRPTEKFPEDPHPIREGVAPLKDAKDKDIPVDARWTKISRELVNPDCLIEAKERYEEREDCVIVLRVLTKDEIQKLADRTAEIRYARYEESERARRGDRGDRSHRRRRERDHDRRERDEYSDHSEDEYEPRAPRLLEAPGSSQDSASDFIRERRRDRDHERGDREAVDRGGDRGAAGGDNGRGRDGGGAYMSGGL